MQWKQEILWSHGGNHIRLLIGFNESVSDALAPMGTVDVVK